MTIYHVTVGGKEYRVQIEDVNAQPVRTVVNDRVVEVWVQEPESVPALPSAQPAAGVLPSVPTVAPPTSTAAQPGAAPKWEVRAPMPGTIVDISVQPGDQVEIGQDLCVLDAMKMNNRIRARRAGTIAQVHVSIGQQIQYGQPLVTFGNSSD